MFEKKKQIDIGLCEKYIWKSDMHRKIAIKFCINNPIIDCIEKLIWNIKIINQLTGIKVRKLTHKKLMKLGGY